MDLPADPGHRVGVLGGTFDPVHYGHLALAEAARDQAGLDTVLLIPAPHPPHKRDRSLTPFHHRLAMLSLAVEDHPRLFPSTLEQHRVGPAYSVDTLRELRRRLPEASEIFFLIGMDAFAEIDSWKEYETLFSLADFLVAPRPEDGNEALAVIVKRKLPWFVEETPGRSWVDQATRHRILLLDVLTPRVSSSMIRERARHGRSLAGLLPKAVEAYISSHGLYQG